MPDGALRFCQCKPCPPGRLRATRPREKGEETPGNAIPKSPAPELEGDESVESAAQRKRRARSDAKGAVFDGESESPLARAPYLTAVDANRNEVKENEVAVLERGAPTPHDVVTAAPPSSPKFIRTEGEKQWDEASLEKDKDGRLIKENDFDLSNWHESKENLLRRKIHPQSLQTWRTAKEI